MSDLRSLADTAAFFSVSQPTLRRWIDSGCPVAEKGASGVAYKLDLHAVAAWRADQRSAEDTAALARAERDAQLRMELLGPDALTVQPEGEALTPKQRADALAAEVARTRLAQMRRELVNAEEFRLLLSDLLALVKTRFRQAPDMLAAQMGLTEPQIAVFAEFVDEILNDTTDTAERFLSDGPEAAMA